MLKRENLSEKLVDIIGNKIIHNELKSGDIIYETQISKEWGVSRSPVRDALHILEQKKLVLKMSSGSYQVPDLSADYIQDFYDTINMLYQYSFSRATQRMTKNHLDILLTITETIENSIENSDFDTYVEGISKFGQTILETANNPIIQQIVLDLMPTAIRIIYAAIELSPSHLKKACRYIKISNTYILENNPQKAAKAFNDFANCSRTVLLNNFAAKEQ